MTPNIVVLRDFDGAFRRMVDRWVERKLASGEPFKHTEIRINSGPYRSYAVSYEAKDGILTFDFYSALRSGFGSLSSDEVDRIINLL